MKILVLEGGGTFGIAQARILDAIDTTKFDCFVGTSIGAANAAVVATQRNIKLEEFFHVEMPRIFDGRWWRKYKPFTPRYRDESLNQSLIRIFDGLQLRDAKKPLFITAVDMNAKRLKVFSSIDSDDGTRLLWEVVRSATAAETYFAPWKGYADGGILANSPQMVAVAAACSKLGCNLSDIELCSIGTGEATCNYNLSGLRAYSFVSWGLWIIRALLNGASSSMHDYFVRSLPVKKYTRIQFVRDPSWNMDNPKDMLKAEKAWEVDIQRAINIVKEF